MGETFDIDAFRAALRRAMANADNIKAKPLGLKARLGESAVRDLMDKVSNPRVETLFKLALALQIPVGMLFGETVPIIGQVVDNGRIESLGDTAPLETVPQPPTALSELVALRVIGDAMLPVHKAGDILYYSRAHERADPAFIGEECAVELWAPDGQSGGAFVKTLRPGTEPGRFTLQSLNASDMANVALAWACPILFVSRALNGKK